MSERQSERPRATSAQRGPCGSCLTSGPLPRCTRVALLTTAIVKKTKSTIADDDERFVAGIFVFVFSDYFTLVLPGNFEEASTLAMMKVLGIEEFHRGFDTLWESYNELVRSRPKILEGLSNACEAWFKNPGASEFEMLVELFKLARTHVVQ
jgi:hypothetical protein